MTTLSEPIVVARRWDGLGGRLHAIMNAWSVARVLGLEFRFVWPRDRFNELAEPRELFAEAFLERFEMPDPSGHRHAIDLDPMTLTVEEARARCRAAPPNSMIEISECFTIVSFADEPIADAEARFRVGLSEIGWSATSQALVTSVTACPVEYSAIHVRAGDIVTGDWRQFVPVDKYMPTAYVEFAISSLAGDDGRPVVVISDNAPYVNYLKTRFGMIRVPSDVVGGYAELTDAQRAFADILVLSAAGRILAANASAFSQLAAHVGGVVLHSIDDVMLEEEAQRCLRESLDGRAIEPEWSSVLRPLLARDICWLLDVYSESLAASEYATLAARAAEYEPDFCGALNRSAAASVLRGNYEASKHASSRAVRTAALSRRHADPLVESLATSISATLIALALRTSPRRGPERRVPRGFDDLATRIRHRIDYHAGLYDTMWSLRRCDRLSPFQIQHGEVMKHLRFQRAALQWLMAADDQRRDVVTRHIAWDDQEPLFLSSWRPSGFSTLKAPGSFPQALRNIEVPTIRIARGIGAALSSTAQRVPSLCVVESVTTSPSGLRTVNGWACEPDARRSGFAVGYLGDDGVASGGITLHARADIARARTDARAACWGFSFPVPLDVPDDLRALQSHIVVSL
jgi:hypothetical protein